MSTQHLFPRPSPAIHADLERLLDAVETTFPLPSRFRSGLGTDVAALSRSLTAERGDRDGGYLGKPAALSAYLRYFLPWNVYRLSRLFPALSLNLTDGDAVTDLGAGPLTVALALWIARPELRSLKLEFRCLDRTGKVLEAGEAIFKALTATYPGGAPWKIRPIRGPLGVRIEGPRAALVTAANVLNELFWEDRSPVPEQASRRAAHLSALAREDGAILVVEPGIPRSGEFVSALRGAFQELGRRPLSPCPHSEVCPLPGGRRGAKWCHFSFDTEDAPERLHRLSAAAGIPKERATLSYLLSGGLSPLARSLAAQTGGLSLPGGSEEELAFRIVSDVFPLPGGSSGRYACSRRGLSLVTASKGKLDELESGTLGFAPRGALLDGRDPKTGALVIALERGTDLAKSQRGQWRGTDLAPKPRRRGGRGRP